MTPAQKALLKGTNASLSKRGVSVTLDSAEATFGALVQIVDEKAQKRLQIADAEITHVLHILRSDLAAANVNVKAVAEIERGDSDQTYRVQYFKADPQSLKILFFCISA